MASNAVWMELLAVALMAALMALLAVLVLEAKAMVPEAELAEVLGLWVELVEILDLEVAVPEVEAEALAEEVLGVAEVADLAEEDLEAEVVDDVGDGNAGMTV